MNLEELAEAAAEAEKEAKRRRARERMAQAGLAVSLSLAAAGGGMALRTLLVGPTSPQLTMEKRITSLTTALADASRLIDEMQQEVQDRQALVAKLQKDVDTYNKLAELKKPEVEAVAQILRGEVEQQNRRSFWVGFGINVLLFMAGAAVTIVFSGRVKWFRRRVETPPAPPAATK